MPRNSSAMRKYLVALSREVSLCWSHRFGGARRKPEGGGPAGVAALMAEVEKEDVDARTTDEAYAGVSGDGAR